jgi:uncharacterized integral membrane protein
VSGSQIPPGGSPSKGEGIPWKVVLWVALALYALVFLLVNSEKQDVSFVFFTVKTRLIWLILLSMLLGALLATVGERWWRRRGK